MTPKFLTATEARAFLQKDADGYVQHMTTYDLYARKSKSIQEYIERISQATADFTPQERGRLTRLVAELDRRYPYFQRVPWGFLKMTGAVYEDGMPHTRGTWIILAEHTLQKDDDALLETLLHEKIHVYQRMHPQHMEQILAKKGYTRWKLRAEEPMARANPDLDPWIYLDPITKKPMVALYSSATPSSISDVSISNIAFEHPLEAMAYQIANGITKELE